MKLYRNIEMKIDFLTYNFVAKYYIRKAVEANVAELI